MSKTPFAALVAFISLACASTERSGRAVPARASEEVPPAKPAEPQVAARSEAQPPAAPAAPDPGLERLRGLLTEARTAKEENDIAGARARIASAIDQALADLGSREDSGALGVLEEMALFAREAGDLPA